MVFRSPLRFREAAREFRPFFLKSLAISIFIESLLRAKDGLRESTKARLAVIVDEERLVFVTLDVLGGVRGNILVVVGGGVLECKPVWCDCVRLLILR
ncbi:unnamed protein product [Pieris brassicae]|uniref:Uncharacterized protein n=1 Tax=Pieris brassicae TaxID=7116 RepID=A0A9P0SQQ9_PIEBR|nr:unnamed protein product [Pieris brassicae]